MAQLCMICSQDSDEELITLTNGHVVHLSCEGRLSLECQKAQDELEWLRTTPYELESKIRHAQEKVDQLSTRTVWSQLYERLLGQPSAKEVERQQELRQTRLRLQRLRAQLRDFEGAAGAKKAAAEREVEKIRAILESIYDYWPDYPPDWENRREQLEEAAGAKCQRCGFKKYRGSYRSETRAFHVHHRIPISKGGNHRLDNLRFLCSKCHQRSHPYDIGKDVKSIDISRVRTTFTEKVALINEAINTGAALRFRYKKRNGTIMVREVRPAEIKLDCFKHQVQVLAGYCYLRHDTRHFTIARMSQMHIIPKDS